MVEDEEQGICGYVLGALDTKAFYAKTQITWIPAMKEKYPLLDNHDAQKNESTVIKRIGGGGGFFFFQEVGVLGKIYKSSLFLFTQGHQLLVVVFFVAKWHEK